MKQRLRSAIALAFCRLWAR